MALFFGRYWYRGNFYFLINRTLESCINRCRRYIFLFQRSLKNPYFSQLFNSRFRSLLLFFFFLLLLLLLSSRVDHEK